MSLFDEYKYISFVNANGFIKTPRIKPKFEFTPVLFVVCVLRVNHIRAIPIRLNELEPGALRFYKYNFNRVE